MPTVKSKKASQDWRTDSFIEEVGDRGSCLGTVLWIKIRRYDEKPMSWPEIWNKFVERYPDRWAVQCFPPEGAAVDSANCYHLWVLPEGYYPTGLDIRRS